MFNFPEKAPETPVEKHKGSWEETSVSGNEKCTHETTRNFWKCASGPFEREKRVEGR